MYYVKVAAVNEVGVGYHTNITNETVVYVEPVPETAHPSTSPTLFVSTSPTSTPRPSTSPTSGTRNPTRNPTKTTKITGSPTKTVLEQQIEKPQTEGIELEESTSFFESPGGIAVIAGTALLAVLGGVFFFKKKQQKAQEGALFTGKRLP